MGKNITVYFDDELLKFLTSQKEPNGAVIKKAVRQLMRKKRPDREYDEIVKAAAKIGKNEKFKQVVEEWSQERDQDRW